MNNADQISQAEKRRIMAEERRMRTYHGHAQANIDEDRNGRYGAIGNSTTVVGSNPISYPRQPAGSPWAKDECPPEPSLGYSVDDQEPTGEVFERDAPALPVAPVGAGDGGGSAVTGRPVFPRRRF